MREQQRKQARVVDTASLSPEVAHVVFEVVGEASFVFRPGQYVCLSRSLEGEPVRRYYSIASAPNGSNRFELCLRCGTKRAPDTFVQSMKMGDCLDLEGPAGNFFLRENPRESVFVVNGTGISPVRSMLHYVLRGERDGGAGHRFTLIFGARGAGHLYFRAEFEQLQRRYPSFRFWPTLSRPAKDWSGRRGYAQEHVSEALDGKTRGVDVYLCGRPDMVRETRSQLLERGFDEDSILYEKHA